jgi:hypothetical protein
MSNSTVETVDQMSDLEPIIVIGSCCPFIEGAKIIYISSLEVNLN